jgi:hypothetical protein
VPETFQSLAVLAIALLPGALYVWAFERYAGAWGVRLTDRLLRFVGFSALLHAALVPVTYVLWNEFIRSGRVGSGHAPLSLWLAPILYTGLPIVAGSVIGRGTRKGREWARFFTGPDPAPRAWDHVFASAPDGWIRLRLKSGTWLGGAFARRPDGARSYAAGYPEEQDLYLLEAVEVDPDTGRFMVDDAGVPVSRGSSILVRWNEVEYLDFVENVR